MQNLKKVLKLFIEVNWIKTIYFTFHYLKFTQAIYFPVFIFRNTKLARMNGNIVVDKEIKWGKIRIGQYGVGTLDIKYDRTIWQNNGLVIFQGKAYIGSGTKIGVDNDSTLIFGENFCVTGGSQIICNKHISFGDNCLLSWDILIMDTDFHNIINESGNIINCPKPINIGNNVWIGCRNTILKGVNICNDVVVAAGSKITKDIKIPNCIVGGVDNLRVLKENITWRK